MAGHDKRTADGKRFFKELEELAKLEVRIGYQHGKKAKKRSGGKRTEDTEADITDVAMWNELGTEHSPPRPFLRQSVDNNTAQIAAMCKAQLAQIAKGQATAKDALQVLGVMQKGLIQNEIEAGSFTPNADSTIKKKGSDKPLIDTGHLRQSVNFAVQPKGEKS